MKRTIEQWKNCIPQDMAYKQSQAAQQFAFEDAKADILELHAENLQLRNIAAKAMQLIANQPEFALRYEWADAIAKARKVK